MLFDSHTHLNSRKFDSDRAEVIERALEAGVSRILNVGYNRETIPESLKLAEKYDFIYCSVGWHPVDAIEIKEEDWAWLESLCSHDKVVAIGEMGLDYYWDTSPKDVQQEVFRRQIVLAREQKMPIIIHNRDAHNDVVDILREENAAEVGGVMHCFTGDWEIAKQCLDLNFYISFGGPITFKNGHLARETLAKVPLDRLLIETDAPYLAPHPYRGKRNETAYVRLVAEAAAQIKGISLKNWQKLLTAMRALYSAFLEHFVNIGRKSKKRDFER